MKFDMLCSKYITLHSKNATQSYVDMYEPVFILLEGSFLKP